LVFCDLGCDTSVGSIKCPLVFWLVHANCGLETLWLLICNLEIYKFAKLQSCSLVILSLQFLNLKFFDMHKLSNLQNYLYVDFHIWKLAIYNCALANFNFVICNCVILSCCKFLIKIIKFNCNIVICEFVICDLWFILFYFVIHKFANL